MTFVVTMTPAELMRRVTAVGAMLGLALVGSIGTRQQAGRITELWRAAWPGRGTPVVSGNTAYYLTREREVIALALPAGALLWRRPVLAHGGGIGVGSRLLVLHDLLIAGVDDLVAINRHSARDEWRTGDVNGYRLGTYVGDVVGPLILCGSAAGRIVAVEWRTGRIAWQQEIASDHRSTVFAPVADARGAIAAFTTFGAPAIGGLAAFDPENGRVLWRRVFPAESGASSGWAGGPVLTSTLVVVADATGRIIGIDRATGETAWTIPYEAPVAGRPSVQEFRSLAVVRDTIFASALDGSVAAYRLSDRSTIWRYFDPRNGSAGFGLTTDPTRIWCPFIGGLVALDQRTGREVWRAPGGATGNAQPPLIQHPLMLAAGSGGLMAFRVGERP